MKKIKYLWLGLFISLVAFIYPNNVNAASASISVYNSRSNLVVGNTFTTTVTVSSSSALGAWNFDLKYDSSKLSLVSSSFGGTYIADVYKSANQKSATYTFTFKAKSSGSASVYVANSKVIGYDETTMSVTNGSSSISIITQAQLEASYSKNNYLSSLSVEGVSLSPTFDKETTSYKVELENDVKEIVINAKVADATASVTGIGKKSVSEGENKFQIKVTAQNGNVRTYTINATVKELAPINVTIDGKEYSVVRKKEHLEMPNNYTEKTIKIYNEDVPAFYNEVLNYTLVGLKDNEGNIKLYIYDTTNDSFTLYKAVNFNRLVLQLTDVDMEVPKNYKETILTINDYEVKGYKVKDTSRYALIYGVNVESGDKGFYLYDNYEETVQRYYTDEVELLNDELEQTKLFVIVFASSTTFLAVILIIVLICKLRKPKKDLKRDIEKTLNLKA